MSSSPASEARMLERGCSVVRDVPYRKGNEIYLGDVWYRTKEAREQFINEPLRVVDDL